MQFDVNDMRLSALKIHKFHVLRERNDETMSPIPILQTREKATTESTNAATDSFCNTVQTLRRLRSTLTAVPFQFHSSFEASCFNVKG